MRSRRSVSLPTRPKIGEGERERERENMTTKENTITKSYLIGQCLNAVKMAVWWTATTPMIYGLSNSSDFAIGACRFAYNIALFLFSPLAGALMESGMKVKTNLVVTNLGRALLFVIMLPLAWLAFSSGEIDSYTNRTLMVLSLIVVFFADGINVAFTAIVDIDMSGVDLLCSQYGIQVNDKLRHRMNSLFQIVMDSSMIFFSPIVAVGSYGLSRYLEHNLTDHDHAGAYEGGGILGGIALVFLFTSILSQVFYSKIPAPAQQQQQQQNDNDGSAMTRFVSLWRKSYEGVQAVWSNRPIFWRIVFLALEQSLEDAMIGVMLAEFGLSSEAFGKSDNAIGNIWVAALIACGKIGGVLSAQIYSRCFSEPTKSSDYVPLFASVFVSGASVMLMPVARLLPKTPGMITVFVSAFMFFFFSTPPKIGFQTLLQGLVVKTKKAGTIFGCIGPVVMITDSLVIFLMTIGFQAFKNHYGEDDGFAYALWCMASVYLLHGIFELVLGPTLVLSHLDSSGDLESNYAALGDNDDDEIARNTPKEIPRTPRQTFPDPRSPWVGKKGSSGVSSTTSHKDRPPMVRSASK